jgi:hypothetical protein
VQELEFSKDMTHFRRVLKPAGASGAASAMLHLHGDVVLPMIDALGTGALAAATVERQASAAVTSVDANTAPAAGFLRYVLYAHVFHSVAGAGTRVCWLTVRIQDNGGVNRVLKVCPHATVDNATPVELPRVIVLPPGCFLQGRCSVATGAGENLTVEYYFVDVPIGEYLRL